MADKRTYEGMFLVDTGQSDFETSCQPIRTVLDRGEADVLAMKPWDERRLAYEIAGRRRALYVLTYFNIDPMRITELERDIQLNDEIIRALLLRKDGITDEVIAAETPATSGRSNQRDDDDRRPREPSPDEGKDKNAADSGKSADGNSGDGN